MESNTSSTSVSTTTDPTSSSTLPTSSSTPTTPTPSSQSSTNPLPTTLTPTPPLSVSTSASPTSDTTTQTTPPTTLSTPTTTTSRSTQTSLSTAAGGNTVTLTSVVAVTPTGSVGPSGTSAPGTSKTFFQNTGAVAGVFTVVGLIVVGLLIALVTNTLRRRRAKRFDREIEEAAAEAAAVPAPAFLDDDDDPYGPRVYGTGAGAGFGAGGYGHGGGDGYDNNNNNGYSPDRAAYSDGVGQYSDVSSHGTFGQPAMSASGHPGETYGMRELGPGVGELYNPNGGAGAGMMAAGAGAAGIGVMRARSAREPGGYAIALNEGSSPYPAFATPGGMYGHPQQQPQQQQQQQQHDYNNAGGGNSGANGALLDAAGLGAGTGALQRGISLQHQPYAGSSPSSHPSDLSRNQSLAAGTRSPESYASHYESTTSATSLGSGGDKYSGFSMPQYVPQQQQQQQGADLRRNLSTGHSVMDDVDPYGGYEPEQGHGKGVRGRYADGDESSGEEDEGQGGRRVLKVANE